MSNFAQKDQLLQAGIAHMDRWCVLNKVIPPEVLVYKEGPPEFGVCAYYRPYAIRIWVYSCASIGTSGRQWSFPGYTVDRTPYGVIAHELAHHLDGAEGAAGGHFGRVWAAKTREAPISGYAPNYNEWFAEMFRVYVTNPDLLRRLRPKTFELMAEHCGAS
jgi:hypothetical protein